MRIFYISDEQFEGIKNKLVEFGRMRQEVMEEEVMEEVDCLIDEFINS